MLRTLTLFLGAAIAATTSSELRAMPIQPLPDASPMVVQVANGCGPYRYRGPGGACHLYGRGPYPGGYYGWRGGNGCPPGYWRGPWGTAATRRFTDGIRTDRGIRPRLTISSSEGRLSGPPFLFASCDCDHGFGSKITAVEPRSCGAFFAPLRRAWLSRPAIAGNPSPAKPSSIIAHVEGSGTVAVKMISASVSMPSICKLPELVGN